MPEFPGRLPETELGTGNGRWQTILQERRSFRDLRCSQIPEAQELYLKADLVVEPRLTPPPLRDMTRLEQNGDGSKLLAINLPQHRHCRLQGAYRFLAAEGEQVVGRAV